MKTILLAAIVSIALAACGPSKDDLQNKTKELIQQSLNKPELASLKLNVEKVILVHEDGNKYKGQATIILDGKPNQVPITVLADKENVMYSIEQQDLLFIAQAAIQHMLSPPPQEQHSQPPAQIQRLIDNFQTLSATCQTGMDEAGKELDAKQSDETCRARDVAYAKVKNAGWCWGSKSPKTVPSDYDWVQCSENQARQ